MKKPNNNNKYRNNNNYNNNNHNQGYSLNYKFDSNSIAGKVSGTALELIKKYNDLAKEASQNGDRVDAETFRQYAEHYRKIVTDINERKNNGHQNNQNNQNQRRNHNDNRNASVAETAVEDSAEPKVVDGNSLDIPAVAQEEPKAVRKEFTVIEIADAGGNNEDESQKPKRTYRRKVSAG
jgi:hypothetical protein